MGYLGSAWATLICYAIMMIASYLWGQKHYYIDYKPLKILGYLTISLILYALVNILPLKGEVVPTLIGNALLLLFMGIVYQREKDHLKLFIKK